MKLPLSHAADLYSKINKFLGNYLDYSEKTQFILTCTEFLCHCRSLDHIQGYGYLLRFTLYHLAPEEHQVLLRILFKICREAPLSMSDLRPPTCVNMCHVDTHKFLLKRRASTY